MFWKLNLFITQTKNGDMHNIWHAITYPCPNLSDTILSGEVSKADVIFCDKLQSNDTCTRNKQLFNFLNRKSSGARILSLAPQKITEPAHQLQNMTQSQLIPGPKWNRTPAPAALSPHQVKCQMQGTPTLVASILSYSVDIMIVFYHYQLYQQRTMKVIIGKII